MTKEELQEKMLRHDKTRLMKPETLVNRVVYDCLDESPFQRNYRRNVPNGAAILDGLAMPPTEPIPSLFVFLFHMLCLCVYEVVAPASH
jgi:hypothetical protein